MFIVRKFNKADLGDHLPILKKITDSGGFDKEEVLKLHKIFIAFDGDRIAGFGGIACYHGHWCLRLCVVDKEYRGQGLQRLLIKKRLKFLKDKGVKHANIWVSPKNIYSLNNVVAAGFRFVKEKSRVIKGTEYIKLRKFL